MTLPNSIAELLEVIPDARTRYALRRVFDAMYSDVADNLLTAGVDYATATPLIAQTNIATSGVSGGGVALPLLIGQGTIRFVNAWTGDVLVYPPPGAQIGTGAAGVAVIVSPGAGVDFMTAAAGTQWWVA